MAAPRPVFQAVVALLLALLYVGTAPVAFLAAFSIDVAPLTEWTLMFYAPLCAVCKHVPWIGDVYMHTVAAGTGLDAREWYFVMLASAGRIGW